MEERKYYSQKKDFWNKEKMNRFDDDRTFLTLYLETVLSQTTKKIPQKTLSGKRGEMLATDGRRGVDTIYVQFLLICTENTSTSTRGKKMGKRAQAIYGGITNGS